jgi:flagellar FliL protein
VKTIIISVTATLLLAAGGAAAYFYMAGDKPPAVAGEEQVAEAEEKLDPIFLKLNPPIVVNFSHRGNLRYLQTTLELMHTDQDVIDDLTLNTPVIRNNLIMLLSDQSFEELSSKSAKEDLRLKISDSVGEVVAAEPPVEIYLTSFVMQ